MARGSSLLWFQNKGYDNHKTLSGVSRINSQDFPRNWRFSSNIRCHLTLGRPTGRSSWANEFCFTVYFYRVERLPNYLTGVERSSDRFSSTRMLRPVSANELLPGLMTWPHHGRFFFRNSLTATVSTPGSSSVYRRLRDAYLHPR